MANGPPKNPYNDFLMRQSMRIVANGGSEADIGDYIKHAEKMNIRNAIEPAPEQPDAPTFLRGLSQQILQGVSFNYGDEALGTLSGVMAGVGGQEGRNLYRQELEAFRSAHPAVAIGANIAGAAAMPVGAAPRVLAWGGKTAAALIGGTFGALAASGEATGSATERLPAAGAGGVAGGVLGVAGPAAIGLAGKAATKVAGAGAKLLPAGAKQAVTNWAAKVSSVLPGSAQRGAREHLREAIELDGKTATQLADEAERLIELGVPVALPELLGTNGMELARAAQGFRTPQVQQIVTQYAARQSGQGGRLLDDMGRATKMGLQNSYDLAEQWGAIRFSKSQPFYKESFQQSFKVTDGMKKMLNDPTWRNAYEAGRAISLVEDAAGMNRGLPVPSFEQAVVKGSKLKSGTAKPIAGTKGIEVTGPTPPFDIKNYKKSPLTGVMTKAVPEDVTGSAGAIEIPDDLPIRALDYMKKGLDQMILKADKEGVPMSQALKRALRTQLNGVLDEVDNPAYKMGRQIWSDYSQKLEALELGRTGFMKKAPELVRKELAASKDKEAYKIGALQDLADIIHGVGGPESADIAQRHFGARLYSAEGRTNLRRLQELIDDPVEAQIFADRVAGEVAITRTTKNLGKEAMPRPQASARKLDPPGVVRRLAQKIPGKGPIKPSEYAIAKGNEITSLMAKGLDDPYELVAMLRTLDSPHFSQKLTAALRTLPAQAVATPRAQPKRRQSSPVAKRNRP
jgi:hypothetical protein